MITEKQYGVEETAQLLSVTPQTVYVYINNGNIKAVKIGRRWRVSDSEIEYVLKNGLRSK